MTRLREPGIADGPTVPIPRAKLSDQIYDVVYQRIVTGQYPADGKLPSEPALARQFQASRTVIREALAALREDGFIVSRERVGNFVTQPAAQQQLRFLPLGSLADVQRCFVFRSSLEGEAAFFAARHRTTEDLRDIQDAADRLEQATDQGKSSVDLDYAFHLAIAMATHNPYFVTTFKSLINHVRTGINICRSLSIIQPELHIDQRRAEHGALMEALRAGRAEAARDAMRHHIDASRDRVFSGLHLL